MKPVGLCIKFIKWFPIISTIAIIVSFIFALFNIPVIINILSYPVSSPISTCILLLLFSKVFKFCMWHRILIINLLIIAIFSWINSLHRITTDMETIWIILLIASISALSSLIIYSQYGWFRIHFNRSFRFM